MVSDTEQFIQSKKVQKNASTKYKKIKIQNCMN
jgi:hypothetical protein